MNTQRLVDNFIRYIQIDSESYDELNIAKTVMADLQELGCEVYMDNAGEKLGSNAGNIYAVFKGDETFEPILFSAHLDTVKPGKNIKPVIKDGVIYSDKTTVLGGDDKSGVVSVIEAIKMIKEQNLNHPTVEIVFTICEECGLLGSRNLDYSRLTSKKAAVLDSSGDAGVIIQGAPGKTKISGHFIGKTSHAGVAPEDGISAIQIAAEAISNMKLLRIDDETTANIGTLKAEYSTNIVPEKVYMLAEARSRNAEKLDAQKKHMMKCIDDACVKFGGKFEGEVDDLYYPYFTDENDSFISEIKDACIRSNVKHCIKLSGGGSDANNMNLNGIKSVVLGTGMCKVHSVNEEITIKNLEDITKIVFELIKK